MLVFFWTKKKENLMQENAPAEKKREKSIDSV